MRRFKIIILSLVCAISLSAQDYPAKKLIESGKFEQAVKKLGKEKQKNETSVPFNYAMAKLYLCDGFVAYNIDSSYFYIKKALDLFTASSAKEKEKLEKTGFDLNSFRSIQATAASIAIQQAQSANTINSYNHYLAIFGDTKPSYTQQAISARNSLAFKEASQINTIEAYKDFIGKYPNANEVAQAKISCAKLRYAEVCRQNTITSYESFIHEYPDSREASFAQNRIYDLAYQNATSVNTIDSYSEYINLYPDSPKKQQAKNKINELTSRTTQAESVSQCHHEEVESSSNRGHGVYICSSPNAYRYHSNPNCPGLNRCSYSIVEVSVSEAESHGRTPCARCY